MIEDYGSGLNYNRKKWNKLIDECMTSVISILHVFSCRIYGLRKYKKEIKEDEEVEKSIQNRD
mgnify:FL=1